MSDFPDPAKQYTPTFKSIERTSRHLNPHTVAKMDGDDQVGDSGNSVVNRTQDSLSSDELEQVGVFDYFRKSPQNFVKPELSPAVEKVNNYGEDLAFSVESVSSPDEGSVSPSERKSSDDDSDSRYGITTATTRNKKQFERVVGDTEAGNRAPEFELKEMRRPRITQYSRDEEEEERELALGYDRNLNLPYRPNRQDSDNRIARMTNTLTYDEHEDVEPSDEDELSGVVVEKPDVVSLDKVTVNRKFSDIPDRPFGMKSSFSREYTHVDESSESLEQGPKRRINPSPSSPAQRTYTATPEQMYQTMPMPMPYGGRSSGTSSTAAAANKVDVDTKIRFSSLNKSSSSSAGTNIMSSVQKRSSPPFGHPLDSKKIDTANQELLHAQGRNYDTPADMPPGEPVSRPDASRTSKKKKKTKADDGEGDRVPKEDVNGNPVERAPLLDAGGASNSCYGSGSNRILVDQTGASTSSSSSSSSQQAQGDADKKKKVKKKAKEQGKQIDVQTIPGYVGDCPLEKILAFIQEDQGQGSKGKKTGNPKNGVSVPHTVQSAMLPQQQKTPTPVDVKGKKPGNATSNGTPNNAPTAGKEGGGGKKKKGGKAAEVTAPEVVENHESNSPTKDIITNPTTTTTTKSNNAATKESAATDHKKARTSNEAKVDNNNKANPSNEADSTNFAQELLFTNFEDLETKQEEEFQVVKKKEKKKSSGATLPAQSNGNSRSAAWGSNKAHSVDMYDGIAPRTSRQQPSRSTGPPQHSVTPPPHPSSSSSSTHQSTASSFSTSSSSSSLSSAAAANVTTATASKSSPRVTSPPDVMLTTTTTSGGSNNHAATKRPGSAGHVPLSSAPSAPSASPTAAKVVSETGGAGYEASKDCDLSSAAFPSLPSPSSGRFRRNSTGNSTDINDSATASETTPSPPQSARSETRVNRSPETSPVSYALIAAGNNSKKPDVETVESTTSLPVEGELSTERRFSDGAIMNSENFPAMPNTHSVTTDSRSCSSSGDIHNVLLAATAPLVSKSASEPPRATTKTQAKVASKPRPQANPSPPQPQDMQQPSNPDTVHQFLNKKKYKPDYPYTEEDKKSSELSFVFDSELSPVPAASNWNAAAAASSASSSLQQGEVEFEGSMPEGVEAPLSIRELVNIHEGQNNTQDPVHKEAGVEPVVAGDVATEQAGKEFSASAAAPPPPQPSPYRGRQPPPRDQDPNYQPGNFDLDAFSIMMKKQFEETKRKRNVVIIGDGEGE